MRSVEPWPFRWLESPLMVISMSCLITVVTLCTQLTRDLWAIAEFLVYFRVQLVMRFVCVRRGRVGATSTGRCLVSARCKSNFCCQLCTKATLKGIYTFFFLWLLEERIKVVYVFCWFCASTLVMSTLTEEWWCWKMLVTTLNQLTPKIRPWLLYITSSSPTVFERRTLRAVGLYQSSNHSWWSCFVIL